MVPNTCTDGGEHRALMPVVPDDAHDSKERAGGGDGDAAAVAAAAASADPFTAPLRGRAVRGRTCAAAPAAGTWVAVEREAGNPADPRAISCVLMTPALECKHDGDGDGDAATRFLGYLPRSVSCHLSPWIDSGVIRVSARTTAAVVLVDGSAAAAEEEDALTVQLVAAVTTDDGDATAADGEAAAASTAGGWGAGWAAAAAAAAEQAAGGGRLPELTRKRMWHAVKQVRASSDGGLLAVDESAALDRLHAVDDDAQVRTSV